MRIGIDLGGTKIEALLLSPDGESLFSRRVATPHNNYEATISTIVSLVREAENTANEACSVGIGTPGSPSLQSGEMKNCNSTCLNGQFLQRDIERALGKPIRLANDANCFALSEAVDGAGSDVVSVFGVILGTGVGGGITVNKKLLTGVNSIAGEWGHNPLNLQLSNVEEINRPCYCGRKNCIESFLSGSGLSESYRLRFGDSLTAQNIAENAAGGDNKAEEILSHYERQLAAALAQVINILDPELIVLGGGLSKIEAEHSR